MIALLEKAWSRRAALAAQSDTDAYRLVNGAGDGLPGFVAERFASVVVLQVHAGKCALSEAQVREAAEWFLTRPGIESVYAKVFVADRSHSQAEAALKSEQPLVGQIAPPVITARENGVRFAIRPYDGFSTGIFLDQRENRQFLRARAAGKTVLNCFSYTCAFSVYAALGGGRVTSVDLSKRYLEWGRENFALNGIDPQAHRFFATDAFRFFKAARKRGETYDLVVVDPPSFSRNKEGGTFSLRRDLELLLTEAATVVTKGGELFFSTNYSEVDDAYLRKIARRAWNLRRPAFQDLPPVPEDYACGPEPISRVMARLTS